MIIALSIFPFKVQANSIVTQVQRTISPSSLHESLQRRLSFQEDRKGQA